MTKRSPFRLKRLMAYIRRKGGMRRLYRPDPVTGLPKLYMNRYYLFKHPKIGEMMIHQFFMGDRGELHDHPWWSGGRILKTGYIEHLCTSIENGQAVGCFSARRRPGDWGFRPGANKAHDLPRSFHKVELLPGTEGDVITLFFTGPRKTTWGFLSRFGWVDYATQFKNEGILDSQTEPVKYSNGFFPKRVIA